MMIPAKYTARFVNGCAFKPSDWGDSGLPILRIAQLSGKDFDNYYDGEIDSRYLIKNGDLLFAWSATIDSYLWNRGNALLNQHIFKVLPNSRITKSFLYYSLKHYSGIWADYDAHGSTMRHIKKESLGNKIYVPSLTEQNEIANFLDAEIGKVNCLIAKKQNLISQLFEKEQATIEGAISLGIRSNRDVQKTNIPWLPEIPKDWDIRRAKYLFKEANRPPLEDDKIITAYRDGQVTLRENRRADGYTIAIKEVGYQHISKGDLVIHTMDAFAGAIGVSDSDGKSTGEYAVCEAISEETNNSYYAYVLRSMAKRNYIYVLCPSVRERAPRFRFVRFAPIELPAPSKEEQDSIVEYLNKSIAQNNELRNKTQSSIDLLQKFSTSLIAAAVTGQLDIKAWKKKGGTDKRLDNIEEAMAS